MNQKQQKRPDDPTCQPADGNEPADNDKLDAARAEGASIYAIAKAHHDKVKAENPEEFLQLRRQRSGE